MDGLTLLRRRRVLTLQALAEHIAGPIRGSWWGHPKGKEIYAVATALEEARDEVLVAKLVDGKVTFVHRALWPALACVVLDENWRMEAVRGLSGPARALLRRVEEAGTAPAPDAKTRKELETRGLVIAASEHTEKGHHATVLRSWGDWARGVEVAKDVEAAAAELRAAGLTIV